MTIMGIIMGLCNSQCQCTRFTYHFDGLEQDCSNSSALAMELLQSCAKPSICTFSLIYFSHCFQVALMHIHKSNLVIPVPADVLMAGHQQAKCWLQIRYALFQNSLAINYFMSNFLDHDVNQYRGWFFATLKGQQGLSIYSQDRERGRVFPGNQRHRDSLRRHGDKIRGDSDTSRYISRRKCHWGKEHCIGDQSNLEKKLPQKLTL